MKASPGNIFLTMIFALMSDIALIPNIPAFAASMPVPTAQGSYSYAAVSEPAKDGDPAQAKPIGMGAFPKGGNALSLQAAFEQFAGSVDIYLGLSAPAFGPEIFLITQSNGLQPLSAGFTKWKANTLGPVDSPIFGDVPTVALLDGTYTFYVLVTPANSMDKYYLWSTSFTKSPVYGLAEDIENALTPEGKYNAILSLMKSIKVGVYSTLGVGISRGAERGTGDFYLYDFELQMLAQSLIRNDSWALGDILDSINGLGVSSAELTMDELRRVLKEGTQSALQSPTEANSLVPLLVRELGLRQAVSYDMLVDVPADARFDALQKWLIIADILLPIVQAQGPVSATSALPQMSGGLLKKKAVQTPSACEDIGNLVKEYWSVGKWGLGLSLATEWGSKGRLGMALVIIDGLHGMAMAFSIGVTALDSFLQTHYGHESPGNGMTFGVKVEMLDDYPDLLVQCGWLLGVEFPRKGGISGVNVFWSSDNDIRKHGVLNCGETLCSTSTGSDGIATLKFTPRQEMLPGLGIVMRKSGFMMGNAHYMPKLRNILGSISQAIIPKSAGTLWSVFYHKVTQWKVTSKVHWANDMSISDINAAATFELDESKSFPDGDIYKLKEGTATGTVDYSPFAQTTQGLCHAEPAVSTMRSTLRPTDGSLKMNSDVNPIQYDAAGVTFFTWNGNPQMTCGSNTTPLPIPMTAWLNTCGEETAIPGASFSGRYSCANFDPPASTEWTFTAISP